jgi:high-affinity iron transporter
MLNLFLRTLSQGLQAFTPIVFAFVWFKRYDNFAATAAVRRGLVLAAPLTIIAGVIFQRTTAQTSIETLFTSLAVMIAAIFTRQLWHENAKTSLSQTSISLIVTATIIIVLRESMVSFAALWTATIDLQSITATASILSSLSLALCAALGWIWVGQRVSLNYLRISTRLFAVGFLGQMLLFGTHEASEVGLLPWSEIVHTATEPYGPDGRYGIYLSELILGLAFIMAIFGSLRVGSIDTTNATNGTQEKS